MRRSGIAVGLFAAVSCWVLLLSLLSRSPNSTQTATVPAADGSKCVIKFVDKSRFSDSATPGEVTVRMDMLDAAGKPVVNLKDKDFQVIEEDLPGRIKTFRGPQSQVINVVLVIDVSGSMHTDNRIAGARQSAGVVLDSLKVDRDRLAIIPFSDHMTVLRPLDVLTSGNKSTCQSMIDGLFPGGGTSIGPPTLEALHLYKRSGVDGAKMVLVMTDGEDPGLPGHLESIAHLAEETGAQVHTIGFGRDVGPMAQRSLQTMAQRCSGQYQHAPSNDELKKIFNARVQETVNECTLTYDSPYPKPDGLPRRVKLKSTTAKGELSAEFTYQVGPILGGRSAPAEWAVPKSALPSVGGVISFVMSIALFCVLFVALVGGLAVPELMSGRAGAPPSGPAHAAGNAASSPSPTRPASSLPPPPPPLVRPTTTGSAPIGGTPSQLPTSAATSQAAGPSSAPRQVVPTPPKPPAKLPPPPPPKPKPS